MYILTYLIEKSNARKVSLRIHTGPKFLGLRRKHECLLPQRRIGSLYSESTVTRLRWIWQLNNIYLVISLTVDLEERGGPEGAPGGVSSVVRWRGKAQGGLYGRRRHEQGGCRTLRRANDNLTRRH